MGSRPEDEHLDWAFAFAVVHAVLWALGLVLGLFGGSDPRVLGAIGLLGACYAMIAIGLRRRSPWSWWLGMAAFGLPALGTLGCLTVILGSAFGGGSHLPQGHFVLGAGCLALVLLLPLVLFVLPTLCLVRARHRFKNAPRA